eukprot:GILK01012139.1.p1 GENE.GILK01012139.1~~GILK01012139.1.p1  ORF type:complete len:130 (+),score=8.20 GILK01012139.1:37-390(+)
MSKIPIPLAKIEARCQEDKAMFETVSPPVHDGISRIGVVPPAPHYMFPNLVNFTRLHDKLITMEGITCVSTLFDDQGPFLSIDVDPDHPELSEPITNLLKDSECRYKLQLRRRRSEY